MGRMTTTIVSLAFQEEGRSTATRGRKIIPRAVHATHAPHHILSHGIPIILLRSSCGSFFVPSRFAVSASDCRRATLIIRHAHFSFISRLLYRFTFDLFPSNPQIVFWSTYL